MRPLIHQASLFQYQNLIGPTNLTKPVCDKESRSLAADPSHRFLDLVFCRAIDSAGAVI